MMSTVKPKWRDPNDAKFPFIFLNASCTTGFSCQMTHLFFFFLNNLALEKQKQTTRGQRPAKKHKIHRLELPLISKIGQHRGTEPFQKTKHQRWTHWMTTWQYYVQQISIFLDYMRHVPCWKEIELGPTNGETISHGPRTCQSAERGTLCHWITFKNNKQLVS